jgi:predicted kinase
MRRFPQQALLSQQPLEGPLIDRLAERVADFHASLVPAPADTPYGEPAAVLAPMLDNVEPLRAAIATLEAPEQEAAARCLQRLERWTRKRFARLSPELEQRRCGGYIRECHGDMHRGNIVVLDGEPVIFDCIEFNPSLRWIDTMSEIAFLTMDLAESGAHGLARRLLNRYLEVSGDYAGLRLLRFYQVYRALVRAKVSAIQRLQAISEESDAASAKARQRMQHYLALARSCTGRHRPQLFITHGLSGSGKTWLGHRLREHLPIIQIRSDVERKRLFGIPEQHRPPAHQDVPLYGAEATERTYRRLLALARELIAAGFSVLVDATFLAHAQRAPFLALAEDVSCPCRILSLQAPMPLLRERISARNGAGQDASDADIDVLSLQIAQREPLTEAEHRHAVFLNTAAPMQIESVLARITGHNRTSRRH